MAGFFQSKKRIAVINNTDQTQEYSFKVEDRIDPGGNAANFSLSEGQKEISGKVGPGNQDDYIITGDIVKKSGKVSFKTKKTISVDWTPAFITLGLSLLAGALIKSQT